LIAEICLSSAFLPVMYYPLNLHNTGILQVVGFLQVCRRSSGEGRKEVRKKLRNERITFHLRADYFIQNWIFHYFIEKKGGCVTEREEGGDTL
jgi:hypothetical protein